MILYIIQVVAYQVLFLLIYDLFLKSETFFNWNRAYLLMTAMLSMLLPVVKIKYLASVLPSNYVVSLPETVLGTTTEQKETSVLLDAVEIGSKFSVWDVIFYGGMCIAAIFFLYKLINLGIIFFRSKKEKQHEFTLVNISDSNISFSFFRYLFLGENLQNEEKETIIKHELIHVKHWHSMDLMVFELFRIIFWFNPLIYMYQNRLAMLHEFIADAEAVKTESKSRYYQNLLQHVFDSKKISFINPFFKQSLIKKRIVMLQKSKSKQVHLFKYALLIPLVFGMLIYSSCQKENEINKLDLSQYSFSMEMREEQMVDDYILKVGKRQMPEETKVICDKHIDFLREDPDYVQWVLLDKESKTVSFSVHSKDEKLPEGLESKARKTFFRERKEATKMYILYKRLPESEQIELQHEKLENEIEVPFSVIEHVPVFPGCEGVSNDEQKKCISEKIAKHVNKNFNTKIAKELELKGKQRINVIFKIDKEGNVIGVRSRAPHPVLEAEAIRVIKTLPKMIPGMQKGKNVTVPYSLPIIFQVQ